MDFAGLASAIKDSPAGAMLAVCILALGWACRTLIEQAREHRAEVAALNEARVRELAQILPVASKLVDTITLAERLASPRGGPTS